MPVESWLNTENVPDFAAHATAMIDAALTGSGLTRESYWAAVRKGYNTPYNDPPRSRAAPAQPNAIAVPSGQALEPLPVPAGVMAALAAEARAV
jgi:hypothetical protein